jgi:hypothetical protein
MFNRRLGPVSTPSLLSLGAVEVVGVVAVGLEGAEVVVVRG